jgi:sec-independent protein translocase protein TatA
MPNIGFPEIVVLLIIALIVFGPKRLPELGKSLGRGIREFRGSVSGESDKEDEEDEELRELQQSKAKAEAETIEAVEGEVVTEKRS